MPTDPVTVITDERSRGIRAIARALSVSSRPERPFIDVVCTTLAGQDVFNLVASSIVDLLREGADPVTSVTGTLARWRRFWGPVPEAGLTTEEVRGLFGELWFLDVWLLAREHGHVRHWTGPVEGARHDFQWPHLAIEVKATASGRGHIHRINGLDQLATPVDGELRLFSLRLKEEVTAANSLVTLVDHIHGALSDDSELMDLFDTRLAQARYSPLHAERYGEMRFRVVSERLYRVAEGFPIITSSSFAGGVPSGVERVEYEVNLDSCLDLVVATEPGGLDLPPA